MSYDYIPGTVYNDSADLTLVIVNGDEPGQFATIRPKSRSTKHFRSIDAFGAYRPGGQVPEKVTEWGDWWDGPSSAWWKIPDGCHVIVTREQGIYYLRTVANLPFHSASPSSASAWGYKP